MGNTDAGDGYKYRGRGIIQLTGRDNYKDFDKFYRDNYDSTVDFMADPSSIYSDIEIAVISALWYYKTRVMDIKTVNNSITVHKVTYLINGGYNGESHRKDLYDEAKTNITCK